MSNYKVITVTHHNLNINEIGHFFINAKNSDDKLDQLAALKARFNIEEAIYLETCNRVCYLFYGSFEFNDTFLKDFFRAINPDLNSVTLNTIGSIVSTWEGENAVKHIFQLASSMDSLVIGEREIYRQFKNAYTNSKAKGLTGDKLRLLERFTVTTAKEIYNQTKIGEKPLSIVSLAVNGLLAKVDLKESRILLVGAGETNALAAKFFVKSGYGNLKIYNRSLHNAAQLSSELNAEAFHINELSKINGAFDIIFICTSANEEIIDAQLYKKMIASCGKKKVIVDLAVPRNVAAEVPNQYNVDYIDIDALRQKSKINLEFRKKEVHKAYPIVTKNLIEFKKIFQQRQIEIALTKVPAEISAVKQRALKEVYKKRIDSLAPDAQNLIIEMMDYMEKKCVSVPMKVAREELTNKDS